MKVEKKKAPRHYREPNQTDFLSEQIIRLWRAPGKPSAYIKRGEPPTCPELRDEAPASSHEDREMGIKAPFVTAPSWGGTSVSGSARVHVWEWLLHFGSFPLGVSEPDVNPTPHIPAGWRTAGEQPDQPRSPGCRRMTSPVRSLCADIQLPSGQAVIGRDFFFFFGTYQRPGLASSWQGPSLELGPPHRPYAKEP